MPYGLMTTMTPEELYRAISNEAQHHRVKTGKLYEKGDLINDVYMDVHPFLSTLPDDEIATLITRHLWRRSWDMYRAEANPLKIPELRVEYTETVGTSEIGAILAEEASSRFTKLLAKLKP